MNASTTDITTQVDFDFMQQVVENQEVCNSPLEDALDEQLSKGLSCAAFTTGTKELTIQPTVLAQIEHLKQFNITPEWRKLALFVSHFQKTLPAENGAQYATKVIDPTNIACVCQSCEVFEDMPPDVLSKATRDLEILPNGYVTLDNVPVWEKWDGERVDFYVLFKLYRDSKYLLLETGELIPQSRSLTKLSQRLNLDVAVLSLASKLYNWTLRCIYYDIFMELEMQRRKMHTVALLESDHLRTSMQLTSKALDFLNKNAGLMKPKDAIAMLELGLRYSRISMGLQANSPSEVLVQNNKTTNVNVINQNQNTDNIINVNSVENKFNESLGDERNLLSIIHILQSSGALATVYDNKQNRGDSEETVTSNDVIDVNAVEYISEPL